MKQSETFDTADDPGPGHYHSNARLLWQPNSTTAVVKYNGKKNFRLKSKSLSSTFKSTTDRAI